jgi:hypothetical protein
VKPLPEKNGLEVLYRKIGMQMLVLGDLFITVEGLVPLFVVQRRKGSE